MVHFQVFQKGGVTVKGLKAQCTKKKKFCHHLLTLMLFQTFLCFFLLWSTK